MSSGGFSARVGRWLFRWRGAIGVLGFVPVFLFGRPSAASCTQALWWLGAGLLLRGWTAGYIGRAARVSVPGGAVRIKAGPYRLLGHPLYLGNLLLVAGVLRAFSPPVALVAAVLLFFLVEYALIIAAERSALAGVPVDSAARFGFGRVLSEWPTWLVTAAALGLAWVRQWR